MNRIIVAIATAGAIFAADGATAGKVNMPKEGSYEFDFCPIGRGKTFSSGDKLFFMQYDLDAVLRSTPAGKAFDRMGARCLGIYSNLSGRQQEAGMEVMYHNRHRLPEAAEQMLGARYEPDLDRLVGEADVITLHCPSSPETHHLIDARRLALMKPDVYLVNTARGDLIDEAALIEALESGRIGGAGLDVYAREPAVDPRLLALGNVSLLPHLGSATFEGREAAGEKVIANIRFWADGHRPPDQVLEGWS